jgi:hypothetical protein
MARTRHKRPKEVKSRSHARADWKHDDEVELLVCLEYVLSTHKDAGLFKTSLVKHLMNTRHAKYTVPQIERKMKKFWLANRHHAATDPEEIYRLGIKCLPRLSNDLKKEVGERFGTLKDQTLAERLATPRQLRSASRSADSELSRHISLGVEVAKTPSPRKRNREPFTSSARREGSRPRKRRDAESRVEQVCGKHSFKMVKHCDFTDMIDRSPTPVQDRIRPKEKMKGRQWAQSSCFGLSRIARMSVVEVTTAILRQSECVRSIEAVLL